MAFSTQLRRMPAASPSLVVLTLQECFLEAWRGPLVIRENFGCSEATEPDSSLHSSSECPLPTMGCVRDLKDHVDLCFTVPHTRYQKSHPELNRCASCILLTWLRLRDVALRASRFDCSSFDFLARVGESAKIKANTVSLRIHSLLKAKQIS